MNPGDYYVTVTDYNGCTAESHPLFISSIKHHRLLFMQTNHRYAPVENVQLCCQPPFDSYLWNTGDTGMCMEVKDSGIYYVIATGDGGCTADLYPLKITKPSAQPRWLLKPLAIRFVPATAFSLCATGDFESYQ